jgi:hypothetical protein
MEGIPMPMACGAPPPPHTSGTDPPLPGKAGLLVRNGGGLGLGGRRSRDSIVNEHRFRLY